MQVIQNSSSTDIANSLEDDIRTFIELDETAVGRILHVTPRKLLVDLRVLRKALAEHSLAIVPKRTRGQSSGSAVRCQMPTPEHAEAALDPSVLMIESADPSALPGGPPADAACQLALQPRQAYCDSYFEMLDSEPAASSPLPKPAVKPEERTGQPGPAQKAAPKPRAAPQRRQPQRSCTERPFTALLTTKTAAAPPRSPRRKKVKTVDVLEDSELQGLQSPLREPMAPAEDDGPDDLAEEPPLAPASAPVPAATADAGPNDSDTSDEFFCAAAQGVRMQFTAKKSVNGKGPVGNPRGGPRALRKAPEGSSESDETATAVAPANPPKKSRLGPKAGQTAAKAAQQGSGAAAAEGNAIAPAAAGPAQKPAPKPREKKGTPANQEASGSGTAALAKKAAVAAGKKRKARDGEQPAPRATKPKRARADLVETAMPENKLKEIVASLEEVLSNKEYRHEPGQEPFRKLGLKINEKPLTSAAECRLILDTQEVFWKMYLEAKHTEKKRYDASGGRHPNGKAMSKRPDTKARTRMAAEGRNCHKGKLAGHVPGHQLNQRYFARAEISMLGLHFPPLAGISYACKQDVPAGCPLFALSVTSSGCYEDDADDGESITLTGEGGNDLLGNKKQVADQTLVRGNLALVGNLQLAIPVRLIRKNKVAGSEFGEVYIYDGLYDVVRYWTEKGAAGFLVYRYQMQRRPDQGELSSKALIFGGGCAPKHHDAESREKEVRFLFSTDISGGKEAIPVVGVNDWDDDELVINNSGDSAEDLPLVRDKYGCPGLQRYVTKDERLPSIPAPAPFPVPEQFRRNPHKYIAQLNGGHLPYELANDKKTGVLSSSAAMVYECGPWTGCPDGTNCLQAVTQRGVPWRLEVFKTRGRGWGVRSWDAIPYGAYVASFHGLIRPPSADGSEEDDTFVFALDKRSDFSWDNKILDEPDRQHDVKYVLDGTRIGGVGRYINHSCNPNCWVQPVLSEHGDREMPTICFFAMRHIPPMEELAYDYGAEYIKMRLGGQCHCGDGVCTFTGAPSSSNEAQ